MNRLFFCVRKKGYVARDGGSNLITNEKKVSYQIVNADLTHFSFLGNGFSLHNPSTQNPIPSIQNRLQTTDIFFKLKEISYNMYRFNL